MTALTVTFIIKQALNHAQSKKAEGVPCGTPSVTNIG